MKLLAHRGNHAEAPENTLAAFTAAIAVGADGIETDVQLTADGQLILFHDRFAANGKPVAALTRREMSQVAGFDVPTLNEALSLSDRVLWNLEIKSPAVLQGLIDVIREHHSHYFLITSFFHSAILEIATTVSVECGLLTSHRPVNVSDLISEKMRSQAPNISTIVWGFEYLTQQLVEQSNSMNLKTMAYSLQTIEDHKLASDWNIEAAITDFPTYSRLPATHPTDLLGNP